MISRNRKTQELDRIAKAILAADRLRDDEIDAIANAPHMLSAVKIRIAERRAEYSETKNFAFRIWPVWTAAFASVIAASSLLFFWPRETRQTAAVDPPETREMKVTFDPDVRPEVEAARAPETSTAALRRTAAKPAATRPRQMRRAVVPRPVPEQKPLEFYALAAVQDPAEALLDGRIVRVELPKASLLSLGVNVPLENGNPVVKTDLLIGSDGVAKAIRLVE